MGTRWAPAEAFAAIHAATRPNAARPEIVLEDGPPDVIHPGPASDVFTSGGGAFDDDLAGSSLASPDLPAAALDAGGNGPDVDVIRGGPDDDLDPVARPSHPDPSHPDPSRADIISGGVGSDTISCVGYADHVDLGPDPISFASLAGSLRAAMATFSRGAP